MKKQVFSLLMTMGLLAPTITFASEEISTKQENTDATIQTKLTRDGGRNEHDYMGGLGSTKNVSISGTTDLEKSWGYTHEPTKFVTNGNRKSLNDEGEQEISLKFAISGSDHNDSQPNIAFLGVKNKSRQTGAWRLSARTNIKDHLGEKAQGAQFISYTSLISDYYNKRKTQFVDNDLTSTQEDHNRFFTDYDNGGKIEINNDLTEVFTGREGIVHNGVYITQLSNCVVKIPNTRRIQNDDFHCNITWNLAKAPSTSEDME